MGRLVAVRTAAVTGGGEQRRGPCRAGSSRSRPSFRAGVGELTSVGAHVEVGGHRLAASASRMRRVRDDQRHVVLLAIGPAAAFRAKARGSRCSTSTQRWCCRRDRAPPARRAARRCCGRLAQAVEVVVVAVAPAPVLVGDVPDERVVGPQVLRCAAESVAAAIRAEGGQPAAFLCDITGVTVSMPAVAAAVAGLGPIDVAGQQRPAGTCWPFTKRSRAVGSS